MRRVFWTRRARGDLAAVQSFVAQDSPDFAAVVVARIIAATDRLARFPESGRIVPKLSIAEVREVIHGPYRIVYRLVVRTNSTYSRCITAHGGFRIRCEKAISAAWRRPISLRRSSTAEPSDGVVHRRSPRGVRGRADLSGCADRPVNYYAWKAREADPSLRPDRMVRDVELRDAIERVRKENFGVYGARKVWRQLLRESVSVARCTVERLMRQMGLQGAAAVLSSTRT